MVLKSPILLENWSTGMMEYWNDGEEKAKF